MKNLLAPTQRDRSSSVFRAGAADVLRGTFKSHYTHAPAVLCDLSIVVTVIEIVVRSN